MLLPHYIKLQSRICCCLLHLQRQCNSICSHQELVKRITSLCIPQDLQMANTPRFQTSPTQTQQQNIRRCQSVCCHRANLHPVHSPRHPLHKPCQMCHTHMEESCIASMAGLPKSFPIANWCCLTTQCNATLNMLRPCCQNPLLLAHEALE